MKIFFKILVHFKNKFTAKRKKAEKGAKLEL